MFIISCDRAVWRIKPSCAQNHVDVRKLLEDIYSYQTTSCVQREKEEEGEQGVGSGLLVLCRMRLMRLMPRVRLPLGKVPYTTPFL